MAVLGTAFQASRTHWQTVLYDALLICPVAVKLFSSIVIQFSQITRSSALKHQLTEMSRGCSNLISIPGITAGTLPVARIGCFVTSLMYTRNESRIRRLFDFQRFTKYPDSHKPIKPLSIQPFSFWWTIISDGNFTVIAVFCLKMTMGVFFYHWLCNPIQW